MSRVHGQWLDDFRCLGCGEAGPGSAITLGEIAVCFGCVADAAGKAAVDARKQGRDPLRPFDDKEDR
jgi:hypothetical protein